MSFPAFLIIKTSAIGDIIQTFPVLEYLRRKFPSAKIDWVVEKGSRALLEAHPELNRLYCINTKQWRKNLFSKKTHREFNQFRKELRSVNYDAVFDLQGNSKSGLVTLLARSRDKVGFARDCVPEWPNLLATRTRLSVPNGGGIRERYLAFVQRYFQDQDPFFPSGVALKLPGEEKNKLQELCLSPVLQRRPRFMVAFGSKWPNKQLYLPTLESWVQEIERNLKCSFIFIFGDMDEKLIAERLAAKFPANAQAVGHLSLPLWQALMYQVDAVIAMDSAALHLCGTTTTPSFSVFGPSTASFYKPSHAGHYALQAACPYGRTFEKRCSLLRTCPTGACLKELSPNVLAESFFNWFNQAKGISCSAISS